MSEDDTVPDSADDPRNMYQEPGTPAAEIELSAFRQILLWPLTLRSESIHDADEADAVSEAVKDVLAQMDRSKEWGPAEDLSNHADPLPPAAPTGDAKTAPAAAPAGDADPAPAAAQVDNAETERRAEAARLAGRYGEFVFFHDFIQDNLFGPPDKAKKRPITLYRREGRWTMRAMAGIGTDGRWFKANIVRFNLYVFATGAAMLALEVDFGRDPEVQLNEVLNGKDTPGTVRDMTLADAQDFIDYFRRAYVPYFAPYDGTDDTKEPISRDGGLGRAGRVMRHVSILAADGKAAPLYASKPGEVDPAYELEQAHTAIRGAAEAAVGAPPVFRHWQAMVAPLALVGTPAAVEARRDGRRLFRQVIDERVPCMSFISLKAEKGQEQATLRRVERGDWMRIAFADRAGTDALPYSHHFLENFERDYAYDRFLPSPDSSTAMSRILCSGYHFALVGAGWFTENVLQEHFRRHYFQLGLAVNMELASLLAASSRVTSAVRQLNDDGDRKRARRIFQERMQGIHRDFLEFVHLFRFTGMSNQIQPTELFDLWRKRLGLHGMFEDAKNEIETANAFLMAADSEEQTRKAGQLNAVASLGVVLGLSFAFLSIAVFADEDLGALQTQFMDPARWAMFFGATGLFSGLGYWFYKRTKAGRAVADKSVSGTVSSLGSREVAPVAQAIRREPTPKQRDGKFFDPTEPVALTLKALVVGSAVLFIGTSLMAGVQSISREGKDPAGSDQVYELTIKPAAQNSKPALELKKAD